MTSDVYALGMLLFFCLTGRDPAPADREGGFAGAPAALRPIIARAAELDPARRFPSVREFKEALLAALSQQPAEKNALLEPPSFEAQRPWRANLLTRVPRQLGIAWDVCVLCACAVMVAGCVGAIVDPIPENASWPMWYLAYSYLAFAMPFIVILCYLMLDRRPLRRMFPALARLTVRQEMRAGGLVILVLVAAWAVATAIAQV